MPSILALKDVQIASISLKATSNNGDCDETSKYRGEIAKSN